MLYTCLDPFFSSLLLSSLPQPRITSSVLSIEKVDFVHISLIGHNLDNWYREGNKSWKKLMHSTDCWASLVAQWLRIRLPMQGHGFKSWSGKIPHATEQLSPCITTTEPVLWSPLATTPEPASHNYWAPVPQLLKPAHLEPVLHNKRSHCNEKPAHRNEE